MAGDDRTYVKLHDGFDEHPKVTGLSDKAFRTYIEALCYCSRNLTDGRIPFATSRKLATPRVWGALVGSGLVEEVNSGEAGYTIHDYLEHQRSADQVRQYKEAKREAGRLGGKARAQRQAESKQVLKQTTKQTGSKSNPETETETDNYPPSSPLRGSEPKAHRLPDDWEPGDAGLAYARERGIDGARLADLVANFCDHWHTKGGKDSRKTDWSRAWQMWIRNEVAYAAKRGSNGNAPAVDNRPPPMTGDQIRQAREEYEASEHRRYEELMARKAARS
jgi:hypothetical protein